MAKNYDSGKNSTGLGFTSVLTLIFIVLKLVGVINWSWWWVLSPIWISLIFALVILIIVAVIIGLAK